MAYVNDSKTKVFQIPANPSSDGIDEDEYGVTTMRQFTYDDKSMYANIYTSSGRSEYCDVVLVKYEVSRFMDEDEVMMVSKIYESLNGDGEIVNSVKGLCQGSELTVEVPTDVDISNVGKGDLVRFRYNLKGQVIGASKAGEDDVIVLYDYKKYGGDVPQKPDWQGSTDNETYYESVNNIYYENYRADLQLSYGKVIEKNGNFIWWGYKGTDKIDEMFNTASVPVMVYDTSLRDEYQIYRGSVDDIEDMKTTGKCSAVILQTNGPSPKALFVYK